MINVLPQEIQDQLQQETTVEPQAAEPVVSTAEPAQPTERVLTAEDIMASDHLKKLGAAVGDTISPDMTLIRVNSTENDAPKEFITLSKEQIASSPRLRELGASAGDYIVDGVLQQRDYLNNWEQFKYAYDKETGLAGKAAQYLESVAPLGQLTFDWGSGFGYKSPDELYGEGFSDATPEQRRTMIDTKIQQDLLDRYSYLRPDTDSAASIAGTFSGVMADPSTAIPLGAGVKAAVAGGGAMGGAYSILDDLTQNKEVDLQKAALTTAAGGALAGAGAAVIKTGQKVIQNKLAKDANKVIDEAEMLANQHVAAGGTQKGAMDLLAQNGYTDKLAKASVIADRKPVIKSSPNVATDYLDNMIANDSATARLHSETLDKFLGSLSTQVKNISEPIFGRLRKFEFDNHVQTAQVMNKIEGFSKELAKLAPPVQTRLNRHLMNGEFAAAQKLMPKTMQQEFGTVQNTLADMRQQMLDSGIEVAKVENYFPRRVKDIDGLINALGREQKSTITRAIDDYAKRNEMSVASVPQEIKNDIADQVARGIYRKEDAGSSRVQKARQIDVIPPKLEQYYASPLESLTTYLRGAVNDVNRRKFFGRDLAKHEAGRTNLDESIGAMVRQQAEAGKLTPKEEDKLLELMQARFVGGDKSANAAVGAVRDLGYAGTIANPVSAVTQLGDIGLSGALHGFRNTIAGMFGAKNLKLVDLGLEQMIAQELANPSKTSKALHKLFKYSGFQRIDRLGKETVINAAMRKNMGMVSNAKGETAFRKKWSGVFGDEIDSVVADLKAKRFDSENVKFLAFNELSDMQPVSLSEMPPAYLNNPNGRLLYMLKSFTLKQYDIVRRNIVQEWTKGNKLQAVKNAALFAGYVSAANVATSTVKDMMLGRDVKADQIPDRALWSLLGVFGINEYTASRYLQRGDIKGFAQNLVTPATPIIDEAFKLGGEIAKGDVNVLKHVRPVPIVGSLIYAWFGGGAELYNKRND